MADTSLTSAIIVAGGRSTRLGRDKASEPLFGRPLLQHVIDRVAPVASEIIIVHAEGQELPAVDAAVAMRAVADAYPNAGPLGGIYSGLVAMSAPQALAVACDMPLLCAPLLRHLIDVAPAADVVMPVLAYPEPLHAIYGAACIAPIRERLEAGHLKITNFLGAVRVRYVREDECRAFDPGLRSFMNANTDEALARIRELMAAEAP